MTMTTAMHDNTQASDDANAGYNVNDDDDNNNGHTNYPLMNDGAPIAGVYPIAGVQAADKAESESFGDRCQSQG